MQGLIENIKIVLSSDVSLTLVTFKELAKDYDCDGFYALPGVMQDNEIKEDCPVYILDVYDFNTFDEIVPLFWPIDEIVDAGFVRVSLPFDNFGITVYGIDNNADGGAFLAMICTGEGVVFGLMNTL